MHSPPGPLTIARSRPLHNPQLPTPQPQPPNRASSHRRRRRPHRASASTALRGASPPSSPHPSPLIPLIALITLIAASLEAPSLLDTIDLPSGSCLLTPLKLRISKQSTASLLSRPSPLPRAASAIFGVARGFSAALLPPPLIPPIALIPLITASLKVPRTPRRQQFVFGCVIRPRV